MSLEGRCEKQKANRHPATGDASWSPAGHTRPPKLWRCEVTLLSGVGRTGCRESWNPLFHAGRWERHPGVRAPASTPRSVPSSRGGRRGEAAPRARTGAKGHRAALSLRAPVARRDRIVVSTLRCGRSNLGSNPSHGTGERELF